MEGQATIRNEKQVLVSNEQLEQLEQLRNEGNYETVIQICDNILKREPNNTDMLNEKAISLQYLERYSESIQCLDIAIQIEPTEQLFYNKGRALMSLEKFEESIECFNKVIKFNPKHASAWHSISFGLYHLQRFSEAIVYENQAIEINPNEPAFWLGKGHSLSYSDKPEESEQCFAKAKELEEKE